MTIARRMTPMERVFVVIENDPYEGGSYWAVYSTHRKAEREVERFLEKVKRRGERYRFEIREERLDLPYFGFMFARKDVKAGEKNQ